MAKKRFHACPHQLSLFGEELYATAFDLASIREADRVIAPAMGSGATLATARDLVTESISLAEVVATESRVAALHSAPAPHLELVSDQAEARGTMTQAEYALEQEYLARKAVLDAALAREDNITDRLRLGRESMELYREIRTRLSELPDVD